MDDAEQLCELNAVESAVWKVWQDAYDKLYKKYQRAKVKMLGNEEAIYEEDRKRLEEYSTAAEMLVEQLKNENAHLKKQLEDTGIQERADRERWLDEEYTECRNDLVLERCKNADLQRELKKAQARIVDLEASVATAVNSVSTANYQLCSGQPGADICGTQSARPMHRECPPTHIAQVSNNADKSKPPSGDYFHGSRSMEIDLHPRSVASAKFKSRLSKLLVQLLEGITHCRIAVDNDGRSPWVLFTHDASGLAFKLEQNDLSEEQGGKDALLYDVVSLATVAKIIPEWMTSKIVFDLLQVGNFFRQLSKLG